jgi:hypothetical protein
MSYFERYRAGERRLASKSAVEKISTLKQMAVQAEREPRPELVLEALKAATDLAQAEALRYPKTRAFRTFSPS